MKKKSNQKKKRNKNSMYYVECPKTKPKQQKNQCIRDENKKTM